MQVKKWMLATAVIGVMASCGEPGTSDDKKTDSSGNTSTTTTSSESKTKRTVEVSGATRTAFEAKYPQADNVTWNYHEPAIVEPIEVEWEWINWPAIDTNDYVASFKVNEDDYWVWYDESGDWIGTVAEVNDYSTLPAAVNKTIKSQYPGYTITSVDKEIDKNRTAYEIKMEKGEDKMKVLVAENGQVMKKKGKVDDVKIKEKSNP